jgi:uncharacterized membrane protein YbhN (UPF0104 family)
VVVAVTIDTDALRRGVSAMLDDPGGLAVALGAFGAAFVLRAALWTRTLPALRLVDALSAIHVSLGANHLLPLRLGEGARIVVARRRSGLRLGVLTSSTVALRLADMIGLAVVAAVVAPRAALDLVGWVGVAAAALAVVGAAVAAAVLLRQALTADLTVRLDPLVLVGATGAWLLEAVLVHRVATWVGLEPAWSAAIFVATVSVGAQLAAIAPGGFGTYEAAATAAWVTTGADADVALAAALTTHAMKTVWSLGVGLVGLVVPRPPLVGPLRLPRRRPERPTPHPVSDGPIVLFFPAFDEAPTVASVIERTPAEIDGRPVVTVVVDDGSTDATVPTALAAGAEVVAHEHNRGLGAAVRTGLAAAVERDAAVVAFADADGEYPPEQLERLVAPILDDSADVVHGSRFAGGTRRMHPHRWFGNRLLTVVTRWIARTPMTDAQTGYRAYSRQAAEAAEVIHDYNYAQVLTLDLLGKGFVLAEVPIDYAFRTEGRSFVRLPTYLRRVVPAVLRQVRAGHRAVVKPTPSRRPQPAEPA